MPREIRDSIATKPPEFTRAWLAPRAKVIVEEDELAFDWSLFFDNRKASPADWVKAARTRARRRVDFVTPRGILHA